VVLIIAALGCLGLIARRRTGGVRGKFGPGDKDLFPVPTDFILRMVVKVGFVPLNLFAAYIFLRGHNLPGGGFPAGLISALSLILMTFVLGVKGVRDLVRINPMILAIIGVFLALAAALFPPLVQGLPVLHHFHVYLGGFYLGGAFWFDLGVYLAVVGSALKIILPLMKSVHGMPAFVQEEEARFASLHCEPIDLQADVSLAQGKTKGGTPQS
jgi:multisubunit Na+/H+ antiporter MnhB subunit